ncbi:MAG: hypothetical protein N3G19_02450 [Candidatus Pacearchaeota archaeon]|nr:hypothetical protein [Candidatus Pacearchaeota archaeon]
MTITYANNVLVAIVAEASRGLTKQEILEINARTYKAELKKYWDFIESNTSLFIYKRKDKYYLKPSFDYNLKWKREHVIKFSKK